MVTLMKPLALLLLFSLLYSLNTSAQKPFRFKLIAYFEDVSDFSIHTDTLYFGCDSLGGEGYQIGLDILDTVMKPNSWYVVDTIIRSQLNLSSSVNTRRNIKNFAFNSTVRWQTYCNSTLVAIKCDTNELVYNESKKALLGMGISCKGCSIGVWHSEYGSFSPIRWDNGIPYFYNDSIPILESSNELKVSLYIIDSLNSGFNKINNDVKIVSENPVSESIVISFDKNTIGTVYLFNAYGSQILSTNVSVNKGDSVELSLGNEPIGLYNLIFVPDDNHHEQSYLRLLKK